MFEFFSEENRAARKTLRAKRREERRQEELKLYYKAKDESFKISSTQELGDVYFTYPKGTICYLDDKNIFIKEYDDSVTWRRYLISHKFQRLEANPWRRVESDGDLDRDYTKKFYPNKKIREQLKEESLDPNNQLSEVEKRVLKRFSLPRVLTDIALIVGIFAFYIWTHLN